jgi:hypothetical protein
LEQKVGTNFQFGRIRDRASTPKSWYKIVLMIRFYSTFSVERYIAALQTTRSFQTKQQKKGTSPHFTSVSGKAVHKFTHTGISAVLLLLHNYRSLLTTTKVEPQGLF